MIDLAFAARFRTLAFGQWHYAEATGLDHEAILFTTTAAGPATKEATGPAG